MPEPADNATQSAPSTPVTPPVVVPPQAATGDVTALQAAIDAAVDKAVKAARIDERKVVATELGVDKIDAAKAALTAKREADDAAKTETERRETAAAEREAAANAREAAAAEREWAGAVTTVLVALGAPAANVGDLVSLVPRPADVTDLDGAAREGGEALKAKFAALFHAPGAPSGVPGGAPGPAGARDDLADARARGDAWRKEHSTTADPLAGFRRVGAPPSA